MSKSLFSIHYSTSCDREMDGYYVLPPFLNISLFGDSNTDYIRSKMSVYLGTEGVGNQVLWIMRCIAKLGEVFCDLSLVACTM